MSTSPGAVIAVDRGGADWAPLLEGRGAIDGLPTAYVCREFVCLRPVTTVGELRPRSLADPPRNRERLPPWEGRRRSGFGCTRAPEHPPHADSEQPAIRVVLAM